MGKRDLPVPLTPDPPPNPPLTSLKIEQEPAVTEVEVGVVSILMH